MRVNDMNEHAQDSIDTISQDLHSLFIEVAFFLPRCWRKKENNEALTL